MDSADLEDQRPLFYIGHHETKRTLNVSEELVNHAQDLGVCLIIILMQASSIC